MIIVIHGGGFIEGDRSAMIAYARSYARAGFVAATISYRIDPYVSSIERFLRAIDNAIDDGMESVRWARSVASTYKIDPERIAMVGGSAGGVIAMATALMDDPSPGGPLAAYSTEIASAMSSGVNLTFGFEQDRITIKPDPAPILLAHHTTDVLTHDSIDRAFQTCVHVSAAGGKCRLVENVGAGHGVTLAVESSDWRDYIGPHLWDSMDLYSLVQPAS